MATPTRGRDTGPRGSYAGGWYAVGWYGAGSLLAAGAGALLAWQPLALAGVVLLAVVLTFPSLGAHLLLIAEGTMFLSRFLLDSYTIPTAGAFAAAVVALTAAAVRTRDLRGVRVYLLGALVLTPWLVYGIVSLGPGQALAGLRLTTLPLLAVALGFSLTRRGLHSVLGVAAVLLAVNAVAAWVQRRIGVQGLLEAGVTYGDQITEIGDNVLRAPGLMRNSFHLGLFAGAFLAVVAIATFVAQERIGRLPLLLGVPAAVACLVLSTTRTAFVEVVVAAVLCIQMSDAGTRLGRASRVFAAVLLPSIPIGIILVGADSTTSVAARLSVWAGFFDGGLNLLGHGLGSAGAASFSQFSSQDRFFVDNYWLSIGYQFGGIALLVVYLGFVALLLAVLGRRIPTPAGRAVAAITITVAAASVPLEVWEYPGVMSLLGLAFGRWWAVRSGRGEG